MWLIRDFIVLLLLIIASVPLMLMHAIRTRRLSLSWLRRLGRGSVIPPTGKTRILIHGVSLGEIEAIRDLVDQLTRPDADCDIVISTTTDTGFFRATRVFPEIPVIRYPLDFTIPVRSFLTRVQPDLVALVELEVWPCFMRICNSRGIPVGVINGRLSSRSMQRIRLFKYIASSMFSRLSFVGAQEDVYARRFIAAGVPSDRVTVLGNLKWDSAVHDFDAAHSDTLASCLGIDRERHLVVAGSTAPEEHRLIHNAIPMGMQLLCAPRRVEWFDHAAMIMSGGDDTPVSCRRYSRPPLGETAPDRYLLDTIGKLRSAYALADLVIIGRSFGERHGSNVLEAIAFGKPVIIGPSYEDFDHIVQHLIDAGGIICSSREDLAGHVAMLTDNPEVLKKIGRTGYEALLSMRGSSARHVQLLLRKTGMPTH